MVQLQTTAVVAQGQLSGRVENVLSGHAWNEFLAFMARVLAALENTAP